MSRSQNQSRAIRAPKKQDPKVRLKKRSHAKPSSPKAKVGKRGAKRNQGMPSVLTFFTLKRMKAMSLVLAICAIFSSAYWYVSSGKLSRLIDSAHNKVTTTVQKSGFSLAHVIVDGRTRTKKDKLLEILDVKPGDYIFDIDLDDKLQAIQALPWVKAVRIERRLPGTLFVKLIERHPIAFFQDQKKHFLVDTEGDIIGEFPLEDYAGYLIATGKGAPEHLPALIQAMGTQDDLYARITGAVYVSQRRWDIIIDNKLTVKLPEEDLESALVKVAELDKEKRLKASHFDTIDLRNPGSVYFLMAKPALKTAKKMA